MNAGELHPFTLSAPASSGNIGPGFDVAGIAVELRNRLTVAPGSGNIEIFGEGADDLPADESNLVMRALEHAAPGYHAIVDVQCHNEIPLARGLGSSAAAAALGLAAGWTLLGERWDARRLASEVTTFEGHADNAAACAAGGIAFAQQPVSGELMVVQLPPPEWLAVVLAIPERELSTSSARAALPASYERPVAVRAVGTAAMLSVALARGDCATFSSVLGSDVLHEPFRARLVPELGQLRTALAETTAYGVTLSGAGPTVAIWCDPGDAGQLAQIASAAVPQARLLEASVAPDGVRLEPATATHA